MGKITSGIKFLKLLFQQIANWKIDETMPTKTFSIIKKKKKKRGKCYSSLRKYFEHRILELFWVRRAFALVWNIVFLHLHLGLTHCVTKMAWMFQRYFWQYKRLMRSTFMAECASYRNDMECFRHTIFIYKKLACRNWFNSIGSYIYQCFFSLYNLFIILKKKKLVLIYLLNKY